MLEGVNGLSPDQESICEELKSAKSGAISWAISKRSLNLFLSFFGVEKKSANPVILTLLPSLVKNKNKIEGLNTDKGLISSSKIIICAGTFTTKIIKSPQLMTPAKGYSITLPRGKIDFNTKV